MLNLSPERAARLRGNFRGLSVIVFALTTLQAFLGSAGFSVPVTAPTTRLFMRSSPTLSFRWR
ncbi:MAG: hypothetical protein R3A46_13765 [Thermomicrobiales bacterium]